MVEYIKKWFYIINNKVPLNQPPLKFVTRGDKKLFNQENA